MAILGALASIGASFLGGSKQKGPRTEFHTNLSTLPKGAQDLYLNSYIPAVGDLFSSSFTTIPMMRAQQPKSLFDSQALYDFQKYSDDIGGFFNQQDEKKEDLKIKENKEDEKIAKKFIHDLAQDSSKYPRPEIFSNELKRKIGLGELSYDQLARDLNQLGYGSNIFSPFNTYMDLRKNGRIR